MDIRYQDQRITDLWSTETSYKLWVRIEREVAVAQGTTGVIPRDSSIAIWNAVVPNEITSESVAAIAEIEKETRHDVAAFLRWYEGRPRMGEHGRYVHFGLTSSDLVDTAMGIRFARSLRWAQEAASDTLRATSRIMAEHATTPALGYTHGQPAEPTTLGIRANQWLDMLARAQLRVETAWRSMQVGKLSGPVGTYAHNSPELEWTVLDRLGLYLPGGVSQVVPRDRLAAWASATSGIVQVCAKIATDFRLMAHRGEVREGWPEGRIGSSAMPHKKNPVTAEQICGMARLARGYASMLEPVDLWDERDISHSSVERVAIPDLMHVVLHTLQATTALLTDAVWDQTAMMGTMGWLTRRQSYTAWRALRAIGAGATRDEAREIAQEWANTATVIGDAGPRPTPLDMVRRHPLVKRHLTPEQDV